MSEPSLDIELFLNLEITAFDLLSLSRDVLQLPPLLESKSVMQPDALMLCLISLEGVILTDLVWI